jgi:ParB-like chromosome segregation protein Spo0J
MLIDLADLAISIRKTGLTNPITVVRMDRIYRLETGERRWLAYHLLNIYFPDEDWNRIPAHLVDEISVWRQASENNARADLNAISRARQLAILLMDLLAERGYEFYTFDELIETGGTEREYYAQVADGNEFRVPRGEGERLLNAMGLKNPTQIRQYRQLLRLPDEVWQEADDKNLTEGEIRRWAYRNTSYGMDDNDGVSVADANPFVERINKQRRTRIWEYANRFDALSDEEQQKALDAINEDERWLNELRLAIQRRKSGK